MNRRAFIAGLGSVVAWPEVVRAQEGKRLRRIGILMAQAEGDQEAIDREAAIREGLQKLGWVEGRNVQIDTRLAGGSAERLQAHAAELVQLAPDVIVASATSALDALRKATRTIPIVFAQVTDPVGAGFVASLARPGGNITGFTQQEFSIGVKWLELLKEIAPRVSRVGLIYDPGNPAAAGYFATIEPNASAFLVQLSKLPVRDVADIERSIRTFTVEPSGGLIVLPGPGPSVHRHQLLALAERNRLPAVYPFRYWVSGGGLASYGVDNIDLYRRAASYVDRILKGEKPEELPVQHATKFELVINLKTAKKLGLDPPITLLARTDEVIE